MKKSVVVDANLAVKWALSETDSPIALALLKEWKQNRVIMLAPALFIYEVTNVLYQNMRKGQLNLTQAKNALKRILALGIEIEFLEDTNLSTHALELAQKYDLSATCDPHYLAMAEREDCDLWTADARLWRAVQKKYPRVRLLADYQPPTS